LPEATTASRPDAEALEEGDQHRRIGRREHGADEQAHRQRHVEDLPGDDAAQRGGEEYAGDDEEPESYGHLLEHPGRELEPAVEEDERDAEREQHLDPVRLERHVDDPRDRRAENRAGSEHHEHPRQPQAVGERLGEEPGREQRADRADDLGRFHRRDCVPRRRGAPARPRTPEARTPRLPGAGARLRTGGRCRSIRGVVVFLLTGRVPYILLLTLALAVYLTVIELRELRLTWRMWAWWILLVILTHFVGYLLLRGYAAYRRGRGLQT
jgi:hypothetical protein